MKNIWILPFISIVWTIFKPKPKINFEVLSFNDNYNYLS